MNTTVLESIRGMKKIHFTLLNYAVDPDNVELSNRSFYSSEVSILDHLTPKVVFLNGFDDMDVISPDFLPRGGHLIIFHMMISDSIDELKEDTKPLLPKIMAADKYTVIG